MSHRSYRAAQLDARRRMNAVDAELARRIQGALDDFADDLVRAMGALPPGRREAAEAAQDIVRFLSARLYREMERATAGGRELTFNEVRGIWDEAMRKVADAEGIPDRLMGAIRVPPATMLGAFESLNADVPWRTLLRNQVAAAATEAGAIVRQGVASGVGPDEVARRLRKYVAGSEGFKAFEGADGKIDLRKVPANVRGAAGQMRYNAERIAFTEIHNARHEAEVQHMTADPFVEANLWQLAPDRGTARIPDGCDWIARGDYYGLGRGVYPVHATPSLVHPFDRCEVIPVPRAATEALERDGTPKPKPKPNRQRDPASVALPGSRTMTPAAKRRQHGMARDAIRLGERAGRQLVERDLVA